MQDDKHKGEKIFSLMDEALGFETTVTSQE